MLENAKLDQANAHKAPTVTLGGDIDTEAGVVRSSDTREAPKVTLGGDIEVLEELVNETPSSNEGEL